MEKADKGKSSPVPARKVDKEKDKKTTEIPAPPGHSGRDRSDSRNATYNFNPKSNQSSKKSSKSTSKEGDEKKKDGDRGKSDTSVMAQKTSAASTPSSNPSRRTSLSAKVKDPGDNSGTPDFALTGSGYSLKSLVNEVESLHFTGFDKKELFWLGARFRKLDVDTDGVITLDEFLNVPELQNNPLVSRVIKIFDSENNGSVNFLEFVQGMSMFSDGSNRTDVLGFAFKVYDVDNDGFISNGELFRVLKMMTGDNLTDLELQQVVDKTILYADRDMDGKISFEEFTEIVGGIGYDQKMVFMNL